MLGRNCQTANQKLEFSKYHVKGKDMANIEQGSCEHFRQRFSFFAFANLFMPNPIHGIIYILQGFSMSASGSTSFTSQDLLGIESSASRAPSSTGRDSVSDTESSLDGANPRLVAVTDLYFVNLLESVTNITYSYRMKMK